jgi:anti-repressor protein
MNELQVFQNQNFGQVRTTIINGEPWFVAADVCKALDITNHRDALSRVDYDEKGVVLTDTPGGDQRIRTVNEPGLYALVLGSRKLEAKAFKRWITHEVIPSIRQHGMYATPATVEAMLSDPDTMIKTLQVLKDERQKRMAAETQIERQKPLVQFAETCQASTDTLLIRDVAKVIGTVGEKRLFQLLRDWKLIYKSDGRNLPYQRYVDCGYFEVSEVPYIADGDVHFSLTTRVTPKGQKYIFERLANGEASHANQSN